MKNPQLSRQLLVLEVAHRSKSIFGGNGFKAQMAELQNTLALIAAASIKTTPSIFE